MIVVLSTPLVAPLVLLLTSVWSTGEAVKPPPVMFRGNPEHTGYSSARFFGGQGGIRWRVQTGGAVRSSPAVTATRVFVGSGDGTLYAIDLCVPFCTIRTGPPLNGLVNHNISVYHWPGAGVSFRPDLCLAIVLRGVERRWHLEPHECAAIRGVIGVT
jgi:PQQ-like domain